MKKFYLIISFLFCSTFLFAQIAEWKTMNGNLAAYTFKSGTLYAGDASGNIRQSNNNGISWKSLSTEQSMAITAICFTGNTGVASTAMPGRILLSTDGGNTWTIKQLMDNNNPDNAYRFKPANRIIKVDEQTVFIDVYNHPISSPSPTETIVSRDGGQTFQIEYCPGELYHVSGDTLMAFGKSTDMFGLSKFTVFKSRDKGLSWDTIKVSPTGFNNANNFNNEGIRTAAFISSDVFFINANKSDTRLYKTTDGGQTFSITNDALALAEYIHFNNPLNGILCTGSGSGNKNGCFYTGDGGNTWPKSGDYTAPALYLGNNTYVCTKQGVVMHSVNAGQIWTAQSDNMFTFTGQSNTGYPTGHLNVVNDSIAFVNPYGGGMTGDLVSTTDGGLSWNIIKDQSGQAIKDATVFARSKNEFFYSSGVEIRYTQDAGLTYTVVSPSFWAPGQTIKDIKFFDATKGIAYANSEVLFTIDGGQSWSKKTVTYSENPRMSFPAIDCWYHLLNGQVYKSLDTGNTWNLAANGMNTCNGGSVYFPDTQLGFVFGCTKLYKTTDGGNNWTDITSAIPSDMVHLNFSVMAFRDDNNVYLGDPVANNGKYMIKSSDAGNTWENYGGFAGMLQIRFKNPNTGAMLSKYGNFLKYRGSVTEVIDTVYIANTMVGLTLNSAKHLSMYPNPAQDRLNIKTDKPNEKYSLFIYDLDGRLSLQEEVLGIAILNISQLEQGFYTVIMQSEAEVITGKLLIR